MFYVPHSNKGVVQDGNCTLES